MVAKVLKYLMVIKARQIKAANTFNSGISFYALYLWKLLSWIVTVDVMATRMPPHAGRSAPATSASSRQRYGLPCMIRGCP